MNPTKKWNKEGYVARIANANGVQLTIITFEIAMHYVDDALAVDVSAHRFSERAKKPREVEIFEFGIRRAQAAVENLMDALDMRYDVSRDLMSLYIYMNRLLTHAFFGRKRKPLEEVREMLAVLLDGWVEAEKQQGADPALMTNAQQIYAGLTYKKGDLVEYIDGEEVRGFRA